MVAGLVFGLPRLYLPDSVCGDNDDNDDNGDVLRRLSVPTLSHSLVLARETARSCSAGQAMYTADHQYRRQLFQRLAARDGVKALPVRGADPVADAIAVRTLSLLPDVTATPSAVPSLAPPVGVLYARTSSVGGTTSASLASQLQSLHCWVDGPHKKKAAWTELVHDGMPAGKSCPLLQWLTEDDGAALPPHSCIVAMSQDRVVRRRVDLIALLQHTQARGIGLWVLQPSPDVVVAAHALGMYDSLGAPVIAWVDALVHAFTTAPSRYRADGSFCPCTRPT